MDSTYSRDMPEHPPANSMLKRIFDLYAEETITDEQVERVLAPVLRMIREGRFDRPRRPVWLLQPLALTTCVAVMTVTVALAQRKTTRDTFVDIPGAVPPLAAAAPENNTRAGRVALEIKGAGAAELTLVSLDSMENYGPAPTDNDGVCTFEDIPEGTYLIMASLPSGAKSDAGTWIVADGKAVSVSGGAHDELWEGVDVQIC